MWTKTSCGPLDGFLRTILVGWPSRGGAIPHRASVVMCTLVPGRFSPSLPRPFIVGIASSPFIHRSLFCLTLLPLICATGRPFVLVCGGAICQCSRLSTPTFAFPCSFAAVGAEEGCCSPSPKLRNLALARQS